MYEPTPRDVRWAKDLIESIKDGGLWIYPDNASVYQFDHYAHELNLIEVLPTLPHNPEMHERTVATFSVCGYKVIDRRVSA